MICYNISCFYSIYKINQQSLNADIYIAAKQISHNLYNANDFIISDELNYMVDDKENRIYLDNHRIVKSPGFEIFLFNVDELDFFENNHYLYMNITRDEETYSFLIGVIYE